MTTRAAGTVERSTRETEPTPSDGADEHAGDVEDKIAMSRGSRMRRDIGTIAGTAGIAVVTGEGMVAAIIGTWILARNRLEDDYEDRKRARTAYPPTAGEPPTMTSNDCRARRPHGREDEEPQSEKRARPQPSYDETVRTLEEAATERAETIREVLGALWIKALLNKNV